MRTIPAFALPALLLMQSIASAQPAKPAPAAPPIPNVVLTGKAAVKVLKQCSRAVPIHVGGYWTPTQSDIKRLETDAPAFLRRQTKAPHYPWSAWACQYVGYVQSGRRMIYVNCIPRDYAAKVSRADKAVGYKGVDWQHQAFLVADGGHAFFGMEYDAASHQFRSIHFHQPI